MQAFFSYLVALDEGTLSRGLDARLDAMVGGILAVRARRHLSGRDHCLHYTVTQDGRVWTHRNPDQWSAHRRLALARPDPARWEGALSFAAMSTAGDLAIHDDLDGTPVFRPIERSFRHVMPDGGEPVSSLDAELWDVRCDGDREELLRRTRDRLLGIRDRISDGSLAVEGWRAEVIEVGARCIEAAPLLPFTRDRRARLDRWRAWDLRPRRTMRTDLAIALVKARF